MPDGRDILYSVHEATGLDQYLFRIAAHGRGLERGARALHTSVTGPSISRPASGRPGRVAFTTGRIDVGLQLLDLAHRGSGGVIENRRPLSDSTRMEYRDDSRELASEYPSCRAGQVQALGGEPRRLESGAGDHPASHRDAHRWLVACRPSPVRHRRCHLWKFESVSCQFDPDGRSAIISVTDHWESDVMVADGFR